MDRRRPKKSFEEHFSDDVLRQLLIAVYDGLDAAVRDSNATYGRGGERRGPFESMHAFWMHTYARKAFVDLAIFEAAQRMKLAAKIETNNNDSCPHTLIQHGPFLLTPHFVRGPHEIVREAEYRKDYFNDPQQTLAFFQQEQLSVMDMTEVAYAFLVYGESTKPKYPAFVDIVFPIRDCTRYHPDRIELVKRFAADANERVTPEMIPDQDLQLKPPQKEA